MSGMYFRGYRKLLRLSSYLAESEINVSSSSGCNKIPGLKFKCMNKRSFPTKGRFYKSFLTSKLIFSRLFLDSCWKKICPHFHGYHYFALSTFVLVKNATFVQKMTHLTGFFLTYLLETWPICQGQKGHFAPPKKLLCLYEIWLWWFIVYKYVHETHVSLYLLLIC